MVEAEKRSGALAGKANQNLDYIAATAMSMAAILNSITEES